jgi:hypothetical protein
MLYDTDVTVRDVFSNLHARSIMACGGLKESIQDLKRDVMRMVYEVKDRQDVTDEVLADLLGISDRWLRMLGATKPATEPVSDGRRILLLLQMRGGTVSLGEMLEALREDGEVASPRRVQRLLAGLCDLGQVAATGTGPERRYRPVHSVQVQRVEKKERADGVRRRLSSLLSTVQSYVLGEQGAVCSRYQYRVRKDRLDVVAERIREAVGSVLRDEEALCHSEDVSDTTDYTVLLNGARGLYGVPGNQPSCPTNGQEDP